MGSPRLVVVALLIGLLAGSGAAFGQGRGGAPGAARGRVGGRDPADGWRQLRGVYQAGQVRANTDDLETANIPPVMEAPTRYLEGHQGSVGAVRFSPDGKTLATGGTDTIIRLWDVATGTISRRLTVEHAVYCLAYSQDGKWLAAGQVGGEIRVFEVATGKSIFRANCEVSTIHNVLFRPQGHQLVSTACDGCVNVWDVQTGENLRTIEVHRACVHGASLNKAGTLLATASEDGSAKIVDLTTGTVVQEIPGIEERLFSVLWSKNDNQVLVAANKHFLFAYDVAQKRKAFDTPLYVPFGWRSSATPDRSIAVVSHIGDVQVISGSDGHLMADLRGMKHGAQSVDISPDGKLVAGAIGSIPLVFPQDPDTFDSRVYLWNLGETVERKMVRATAFAADAGSRMAAVGRANGVVNLVDEATGSAAGELTGHSEAITGAAFDAEGTRLATSSKDKTVRLWDVAGKKELRLLHTSTAARGVAWVSGRRLAIADGNDVLLWSMDQETPKKLATGEAAVRFIAASPDGHYLLVTRVGGLAELFDLTTEAPPRALQRPEMDEIDAVAMLADGRRVCTEDRRYGVISWDLETLAPQGAPDTNGYHSFLMPMQGTNCVLQIDTGTTPRMTAVEGDTFQSVGSMPATDNVIGASYLHGSDELLTVSIDGSVRKRPFALPQKLGSNFLAGVYALLPQKNLVAAADLQGRVCLFEQSTGVAKGKWESKIQEPSALAFSPDGTKIAVGGEKEMEILDVATGKVVGHVEGSKGAFHYLTYSPDGGRIASAQGTTRSSDRMENRAYIWDSQSGKQLAVLGPQPSRIGGMQWSPDGGRLLTYTAPPRPVTDQRSLFWPAAVWDAETGSRLHTFGQVEEPFRNALFSPDGKSIYTANPSGGIYRYDATSYELKGVLPIGKSKCADFAISPDGRTLVVVYANGSAGLYDARTMRMAGDLAGQTENAQMTFPFFAGERPGLLWYRRNFAYTRMLPAGGVK